MTAASADLAEPEQETAAKWLPAQSEWKPWHTGWLAVIVLLMLFGTVLSPPWVGLLAPPGMARQPLPGGRLLAWALTLVLMIGFAAVAGHGCTGRWLGLLIDERNRMSLPRLQMAAWTLLVLSAFFTAVLCNLAAWALHPTGMPATAMAVVIPTELWLAMGISTASLVAPPLIQRDKAESEANREEWEPVCKVLNGEKGATRHEKYGTPCQKDPKVHNVGQLVRNHCTAEAELRELLRGDEVGNASYLDLGKLQMVLMTLVVLFAYALLLARLFWHWPDPIPELPGFHDSLLAMLGLSYAGYLANTAVPHSQRASAAG
jgi:hypothetical protein